MTIGAANLVGGTLSVNKVVGGNVQQVQAVHPPGNRAGIHMGGLARHDVTWNDGAPVGYNLDSSVGPGKFFVYLFYVDTKDMGVVGFENLANLRNTRPDGRRQHRRQADSIDESRLGLPGLLGPTLVLGLLTVGGVSYLDRMTAPTRTPLATSASGVHQHLTTPARTLLGPLLASTPEANIRLEARASTETTAAEPGLPSGQKIMLDFQITDAHTGQPLAGLSPTASLESAVPPRSARYPLASRQVTFRRRRSTWPSPDL